MRPRGGYWQASPDYENPMPRFIVSPRAGRKLHAKLVQELAHELANDSGKKVMPYVLEEQVEATGLRTATVIWDRFHGVPEEDRSDIILAAYESAEGKEYAESIAIPLGFTPKEAVALGYLPYRVILTEFVDDPRSTAARERAFSDAAARSLLGKKTQELRYARREEASAAAERLSQAAPGSHWAVIEEKLID